MGVMILDSSNLKKYIDYFNDQDEEFVKQHIDNKAAFLWLVDNIPFFECPDKEIEKIYYLVLLTALTTRHIIPKMIRDFLKIILTKKYIAKN